MLKRLLLSIALILGASSAGAVDLPGPVSSQVVTVSTTPIGVSCTGSGVSALIQSNGADIRFTLYGETPSTSTSYLLFDGQFFTVNHPTTFLAVRAASTDATMKVTCLQN